MSHVGPRIGMYPVPAAEPIVQQAPAPPPPPKKKCHNCLVQTYYYELQPLLNNNNRIDFSTIDGQNDNKFLALKSGAPLKTKDGRVVGTIYCRREILHTVSTNNKVVDASWTIVFNDSEQSKIATNLIIRQGTTSNYYYLPDEIKYPEITGIKAIFKSGIYSKYNSVDLKIKFLNNLPKRTRKLTITCNPNCTCHM